MTSLTQDIKDKLYNLNILEKIIAINIVIFGVERLLKLDLVWFKLPSHLFTVFTKPWAIVSYAFLHHDFWHLFFNMLWLYFIGRMFLNLFSIKTALYVYVLGAIVGGLLFSLSYTLFPNIFGNNAGLVGASGAVRALLIFLCAYMPNQDIRFFTFNIKLWYIGVGLVLIDVIGVFSGIKDPVNGNAGGHLAHLGGALLGFIYAKQLASGQQGASTGFDGILSRITNMFNTFKKSPLKTVHKNKSKIGGYTKSDFNEFNNQKKIDVILDKISKSGYDSLTGEEKELLFRAGKS
ncbi:rhomboid family intramembrane serine protease [uncultured Algibacter sp.]|uniref:rhomboid family intramembrane serine protease n=1 Tax=uncultured Algibacter sp. TaxID=298659 RepID=UPI003217E2FF